ncbi:MAG TPA: hypothetical protein VIF81_09735 [Pyrinomonadaceae bacterium]|jgi:hypothetical protein
MKRQLIRLTFLAGLLALFIPAVASAQSRNDPWGWPDYRRDQDRDYGRYDNRYLRDSIQRLDRLAKDFERELDRDLDRDRRENGSRHEDRVNNEAHDFRNAVGNLKSAFGNGRDLNRSADEAQRVMRQANITERATRHHFDNYRLSSLWSQIRNELNTIGSAYGYRGSVYGDDDYGRSRRNDDDIYRRRDDNRRQDNRNNVPWWQRIPGFPY